MEKNQILKKSIAWSGRITVSGGVRVRVSSCGVKYPVWLLPERSLASIRPFQHGAAWGGVQERSRPDSSPQRGDQRGNAAFEIRTSSLWKASPLCRSLVVGCPHTRGRLSAWDTSSREGHEGEKAPAVPWGKSLTLGKKLRFWMQVPTWNFVPGLLQIHPGFEARRKRGSTAMCTMCQSFPDGLSDPVPHHLKQ